MLEVDENVTPFILKKLNVNVPLFIQILNNTIRVFLKLQEAKVMLSRTANNYVKRCRKHCENEWNSFKFADKNQG
jgi:hypothetical protein